MRLVIAMLALLLLFSGASAQGNLWYGGWLVVPNWTWQSPSRPVVAQLDLAIAIAMLGRSLHHATQSRLLRVEAPSTHQAQRRASVLG
jgi:hypothetical protein